MKILIDTNVLISAALFPGSVSALAVETVMKNPSEVILCDYVLKEMRKVFIRKFPLKISALNSFINMISETVEIVEMPDTEEKYCIRDIKDEPILAAAVFYGADVILTGDRDFAAVIMERPLVLTPGEYLRVIL